MKRQFYRNQLLALWFIMIFTNLSMGQSQKQKLIDSQKSITREELIGYFVKAIDGYSGCIPVFVSSDLYRGRALVQGYELFNYYRYELLDSAQRASMEMEEYYTYAKDLILSNDTINLGSKKLGDSEHGWQFSPIEIIDSIQNYPEKNKQKLIDMVFRDNGIMRQSFYPEYVSFNFGAVVAKLFDWNILVAIGGNVPNCVLFDFTIFRDSHKFGQPTDMINDCLITFIDHIKDSNSLYVVTDFYPYNFYFRDDEMDKRGIIYISIEDLRDKSNLYLLKDGIKVIYFESIKLEKDLITFIFTESTMVFKEKKQLARIPPVILGNYTYQYFPITQSWILIETMYESY